MLAALLVASTLALGGEASARWRCQPAEVEVGEPFALVLELAHPAALSGGELLGGALALDESWVVLGEDRVESTARPDGTRETRRAWRVCSLEPGERSLAEALSGFGLPEHVARIQVGDARVSVRGVLAEGEDAPRPLREFPEGFAGGEESGPGTRWIPWLLGVVLLAGTGTACVAWRRGRARRKAGAVPATPLDRLGELERALEGEPGRAGCFELTRLLREAADGARARDRAGLTDEEWLEELSAAPDVPRDALAEITRVFERAARVKYAGEQATPWALQETFARARTVLAAVGSLGAAREMGGRA